MIAVWAQGPKWRSIQPDIRQLPVSLGMDFDNLVEAVVPQDFVDGVKDIVVAMNFTSILAPQAWELVLVVWVVLWFVLGRLSSRRRRRFVLLIWMN